MNVSYPAVAKSGLSVFGEAVIPIRSVPGIVQA